MTVTDYQSLKDYAQRTISKTLKPAETFHVTTQPFPLAWHMDVIHFLDDSLEAALPLTPGGSRRVVSTQWTLPLDGQSDMTWEWQTITDQTVALGMTNTTEAGWDGT